MARAGQARPFVGEVSGGDRSSIGRSLERGLIGVSFGGVLLASMVTGAGAQTLVTSTNISTTIGASGVFQTLLVAPSGGANRLGCNIQNPPNATESLYVNVASGTASASLANSFQLAPGGFYSCADGSGVEQAVISVTASTAGHAVTATKQCTATGTC